ncbi:MAG: hypothetical protein R3A46_19885 [Thermomicrobiales bacterium]
MAVTGWAVVCLNVVGFPLAVGVAVFLYFKSRHEERLLMSAYQGYDGYMKRVRARFVPKIW